MRFVHHCFRLLSAGGGECLEHGYVLNSRYQVVYPFPTFQPAFQLKKDQVILLNTSYSLVACSISLCPGRHACATLRLTLAANVFLVAYVSSLSLANRPGTVLSDPLLQRSHAASSGSVGLFHGLLDFPFLCSATRIL